MLQNQLVLSSFKNLLEVSNAVDGGRFDPRPIDSALGVEYVPRRASQGLRRAEPPAPV